MAQSFAARVGRCRATAAGATADRGDVLEVERAHAYSNTHAFTDAYPKRDSNAESDTYTVAYSDPKPDTDADAESDSNAISYTDAEPHADAYPVPNTHTFADAYPDAVTDPNS